MGRRRGPHGLVLCRRPQGRGWACALRLQGEQSSTHHMLDRVGIEGDHAYWSRPLVVFLMDFLVQFWVVKEPGKWLIVSNLPVSFPPPPDQEKPKVGTGVPFMEQG